MDPATTTAIIIGVVGIVGAFVANLRIRSRCRTDHLDISIQKQFNKDLSNVLKNSTDQINNNTSSDSETSL